MERQEGLSTNKALRFDGMDNSFWKLKMEVYLQSLGVDIWVLVENGYHGPKMSPNDPMVKRKYEHNVKTINALLCGMEYFVFIKVM